MDIVGKNLKIIRKMSDPSYNGLIGVVTHLDDNGFIYGTWGVAPVDPRMDIYQIL